MASPTNSSYSVSSNIPICGGRNTAISWIPPVGYFSDVPMTNSADSLSPTMYESTLGNVMENPFILWGGSAILTDWSTLGAQIYYSGGHETSGGQYNTQFSLICDFTTLTWSIHNLPTVPNSSASFVAGYAPDGSPYCPHTYLGLQEFPARWGGATTGSLISFFWAGSTYINRINILDPSQSVGGYSVLTTNQPQNTQPTLISFLPNGAASGGTYPISVTDYTRKGYWLATVGAISYTLFCSYNGTITQYPALGGNMQDGALVICNNQNLLIGIDGGYDTGYYSSSSYRALYIMNLVTGAVTLNSTVGVVPSLQGGYDGNPMDYHAPSKLGLQWVDELGCIVGLDTATTPPNIVKLTPPPQNPATEPWTWSIVPIQHWTAGDPSGQTSIQIGENSAWSRIRWVPSLHAFVYGSLSTNNPQIINIT